MLFLMCVAPVTRESSGFSRGRRAFHIPCCILLMKTIIFVIGVLKEGKEGGWKREEGGKGERDLYTE